MNRSIQKLAVALGVASFAIMARAQQTPNKDSAESCPMHKEHMSSLAHHKDVEKHGDQAMGFPHDKTSHHFRILPGGGAIEITANDASDKANTAAIRGHLSQISDLFLKGDFAAPMFIHDGIPPGVTTMKLLKEKIRYRYEEVSSGARVSIESDDPLAVAAIHDFLRFQISEHQTGDPVTIPGAE
jgi:hypothetical protein